ncbi:STAS domain-containing protein [Adhaeribacter pallidiroseus]|uniref:STAS domain-containing protein n=1 Tax=Adhaeribacter pallidiroseus TaxID=2072847 RepID=A0A369QMP2_9BACT|nr:STAS domain-containing protein [Adhaeribacter pallidiroseus]RDC63488.1 hypothetical protein AHMF7616_02092 [Adhaeribacter pallidiroseus]
MEINTYLKQDHYLISISGDIDSDKLIYLNNNLDKCLEVSTPAILIDCNHLTHVCVAGLRSLLRYQKLFQNQNKVIVLFGLQPKLEAVFFETGLDRFISLASSYNQALNLIRRN